ncbi:MAG: fructosamine kinase family protein [Actinobacteria bacterium]|nr:fructosamine kinase family protein [Actinomycetota bacterium]
MNDPIHTKAPHTEAARVETALRERLGLDVTRLSLTTGGDINNAYRAEISGGPDVFVKTSKRALPGMFTDEAAGLRWLNEPESGIATPRVVGVIDDAPDGDSLDVSEPPTVRLLALEWINAGRLDHVGEELLGRGLAAIHRTGAPAFGATPVLDTNGVIDHTRHAHAQMRFNELALPNQPCATWAEFYAERRIRPLAAACRDKGELTTDDCATFERLCARLPALGGPPEPPARLHGDLWSGNVLPAADGRIFLIDPVAHGGHRELDLALLKVFGGPSERCFAAYREIHPLSSGHEERERLWQLGMILLHVYLFGGGYRAQALSIANDYL